MVSAVSRMLWAWARGVVLRGGAATLAREKMRPRSAWGRCARVGRGGGESREAPQGGVRGLGVPAAFGEGYRGLWSAGKGEKPPTGCSDSGIFCGVQGEVACKLK